MTSVVKILGWKAEGLRCPDHELNCCDDNGEPYPVSLIQMPNGTGKTTTLMLLRAALAGTPMEGRWDENKVRSLRKRGADSDVGSFELRLLLNGRRVTVVMTFDFEASAVTYKTTRSPAGQAPGFDPPAQFRRFMNQNFVPFFVFDGELAQHLLDHDQVEAETVVETLFQINALQTLGRRVMDHWTHATRNASATEERGLARRENRVEKLRERLQLLKAERRKFLESSARLRKQLEQYHETYAQEIGKERDRAEQITNAGGTVDDLKARVREQSLSVLDQMRDPHALSSIFAQTMYELKLGLDRVKLPESAAREFFEELATEDNCVCGRPIDEEVSAVIRQRATTYLSTDDVSLLNSMKTAIQDVVGQSRAQTESDLEIEMGDLEALVAQRRDSLNDLEELRLAAEQADPAVKRASEKIRDLELEMAGIDGELEKFASRDTELGDERTFGIDVIADRLDDAEQRLAEIMGTITLRQKRDVLVRVIESARERAQALISADICAEANTRIRELMPDNRIDIDHIDRCLILRGQEGGSAGETLAIAYAFLATLFNRSEHQLPFVVDSPAGPIDLAVRPRIGNLIPKLTDQFIAFTISSEREGFVQRLKQATEGGVQFLTVFRKGTLAAQRVPTGTSPTAETVDGVLIEGEAFFNAFQLDKED
jgi:DNA sulfur modification protein DndD